MKFGMNLLLWAGDMNEELLPVLKKLKEMGFDGVEVPVFDTTNVNHWTTWGKRLNDLGLERTAVTIRGPEDDPISPDGSIRVLALDNQKRSIDCTEAVGAKLLCGPFHSALGTFSGKAPATN